MLDEPFEAVDPVSGTTIRALLARFAADGGTVVVSSHVMALVEQLCDHVAVIVRGRVVAAGPSTRCAARAASRTASSSCPAAPAGLGGGLTWLASSSG